MAVARRSRHSLRLALAGVLAAGPAQAHGFGQRYDLPLPLSYWLAAAALVVGLSFALAAVAARRRAGPGRRRPWPRLSVGAAAKTMVPLLRALGLAVLVLVVAAGLAGVQSPIRNIAPTLVWVLWWVGLVFVCVLVANPWPALNPWATLYDLGAWAWTRLARRPPPAPPLRYPRALGAWPAVALFAGFAWIELIWKHGEVPAALAAVILAYSALTLAAMVAFGRDAWLGGGEAFTLAFSVFGRFAPIAPAPGGGAELELRPYGAGLLVDAPASRSMVCFVVLMLSTVTFDGLMETPLWSATVDAAFSCETLAPALFVMRDVFGNAAKGIETVALVVFPIAVLAFFLVFVWIMARLTPLAAAPGGPAHYDLWALAGRFAFTLVPIAVGYHFAHYLSFLAIAGQLAIPLASDPFGYGWDLLGTSRYRIDIGLINARVVWYVAVTAIVTGHVIGVVLAHVAALRLFASRAAAILSQVPMLVLMVCYTMLSLWILAQPIVQ